MDAVFDRAVPVHYGFFAVGCSDQAVDLADAVRGQRNGMCGAQLPHVLSMVTGLHTGSVPVRVEWSADRPEISPSWEDVVEVSVELDHDVGISSFEWWDTFRINQAGWHRARFSATAMDAGHEVNSLDPDDISPDRYLLQLWPETKQPEQVIREGSNQAAYWANWAQNLS